MQELEKILEEIEQYRKAASDSGDFNVSAAYEKSMNIIRKHMNDSKCAECSRRKWYQIGYEDGKKDNDGWIPVEERLPEEKKTVLVQWEKYDRYINITLTYLDVMWLDDAEEKVFETINGVPNGKVIAWRPLPEPYSPERSNNHDREGSNIKN